MRKHVLTMRPVKLSSAMMASALVGAFMLAAPIAVEADNDDARPAYRGGMMPNQGHMGPGYMGQGHNMGPGYMGGPGYMRNQHPMMDDDYMGEHMGYGHYGHMGMTGFLGAGPQALDLDDAQARTIVSARLALSGNKRLMVGDVSSGDNDTVLVEIVTKKEKALVSTVTVHRKTGIIRVAP